MQTSLVTTGSIDVAPRSFLERVGRVFETFDQQDSGNVSFGVEVDGQRYFVKTAGSPIEAALHPHSTRVALLHNAGRVAADCDDAVLQRPLHTIDSPHGPVLVYSWFPGDLVYVAADRRFDSASAFSRFRALPLPTLCLSLSSIFRVHARLASRGWVASDFYDGCILFDFHSAAIRLIDLDCYQLGPFTNTVGRLPGSARFMAPEEHQRGQRITERTTVFNMGRCISVFLHERCIPNPSPFADAMLALEQRACRDNPDERVESMAEFFERWSDACGLLAKAPVG